VLKYIDFRQFSIAKKLSVWGITFLVFLFIIVIVNNNQFKILGIETVKITTTEVPAINELKKLDALVYQQTILRQLILAMNQQQNVLLMFRSLINRQLSQHTMKMPY